MQNYNCKNCGAVLYWDVKEDCLKCEFCGSKYHPSDFEDHTVTKEEVKSEEKEKEFTNSEAAEEMVVYACDNCGGEIVTLKTTMATICPYCGEAISITSKSVGNFRPELCIPFQKDKKEIIQLYKNYVNRSFLTPAKFKSDHTIEKCQGLFTPFYLHTLNDKAKHIFKGERSSTRRRGDDQVTTHQVYQLVLEANGKFERIPTDGSVRIDDSMMEAIEPFDYSACKPYNPAYMAGFAAEQTDDDLSKLSQRAEQRIKEGMKNKAEEAFTGYGGVILEQDMHQISNHSSEYVMLPVWLLNVKYGGEKYTFAVNGQSGKVSGKLPIDKTKLISLVLGSFFLSDILLALISTLLR